MGAGFNRNFVTPISKHSSRILISFDIIKPAASNTILTAVARRVSHRKTCQMSTADEEEKNKRLFF